MQWDILYIGGGMACAGAIAGRRLGLRTAVVESGGLGGASLHTACIPTKALFRGAELFQMIQDARDYGVRLAGAALDYDSLRKKKQELQGRMQRELESNLADAGVEILRGHGALAGGNRVVVRGANGKEEVHEARHIVVATGSRPARPPGVRPDGRWVLDSDDAVDLGQVPQSILIVGGGAVGCEFASFYNLLGSKVRLVERHARLLPHFDIEISKELHARLEARGIEIHTSAELKFTRRTREGIEGIFDMEGMEQGAVADAILLATGRAPNTEKLGLEAVGVRTDEEGFVLVDHALATSIEGVYAVGDVRGLPMLANAASYESVWLTKTLAGKRLPPIDYDAIPVVIRTSPEVASVGLTETHARTVRGDRIQTKRIPLDGNAWAALSREGGGFAKLVFDEKGRLLGAHCIGASASDFLSELSLAKTQHLRLSALRGTMHPHPSLAETVWMTSAAAP